MTPEELDRQLRTLSEHEQLYRRGIDPDQVVPPSFIVQPDGVLRSHAIDHGTPARASQPYFPHVFVKQHSRFRDYPLHQQDRVELAYVYDGTSREVVNGHVFTLTRGQVLIVDSDAVHTTLPLGEGDIRIMVQIDKDYFDSSFLARLDTGSVLATFIVNAITRGAAHDGFIVFHSEGSRRLGVFMTEFLCEWYDPSSHSTKMLNLLLELIAEELAATCERDVASGAGAHRGRALAVLRYIEKDCAACTLTKAAERFGMAPDSLSRMLKRETGQTFNQLVQRQRIAVAKALLAAGNQTVASVAEQVGYENMTYFYRIFKAATGTTPGAWRRHHAAR